MHQEPELFEDAKSMIDWLTENDIKLLPRQLDSNVGVEGDRIYKQDQVQWFDKLYQSKTFGQPDSILKDKTEANLTDIGRACCGGRQLCTNKNYKQRQFYVENKFPDWYCSVNHFFLYVKQVNGEIYINKDCKMNFEGGIGPIGHLSNSDQLLLNLKSQLENNSLPIIQCKKYNCYCGLCAPKARDLSTFNLIMKKYQKDVTQ